MTDDFELHVSPDPSDADRDAILAAVRETLSREGELARPSTWRLSGWTGQRVGLRELDRWISPARRWSLSTLFPRGGRPFNGLSGRGDAK